MNTTTFFAYLRRAPFGGKLTQSQIGGVNRLLAACERHSVTDMRRDLLSITDDDFAKSIKTAAFGIPA